MNALPIFLNIKDRKCVVVGGGEVAFRKATLLLKAGASLHLVAPRIEDNLRRLCLEHGGTIADQEFTPDTLDGAILVVAATDDDAVNRRVSEEATARSIPVNAVDQPALCTFIMPSIVDRTPVVIAISSSGSSPVLTRHIKELNEIMVPARIDKLAELLAEFRAPVQEGIGEFADRVRFWESVLDSEIPELVYSGRDAEARELLSRRLVDGASTQPRGEVYLVGAGPGDPDLLTLRALRLMYKADVVLYDRLVSPEIMQRIRPDAEKIHVGKQRANHTMPQETINAMLVRLAREGKRVLRLKGGDPFIFGRGGEELDSLAREGIPFQVVPGITAASGCAAYAGIPLTHREHAHSVQFLTGHLKGDELDLDWADLVRPQQTLVFYMGLVSLPIICAQLLEHGMAADTPIAIVQQGTTRQQQVMRGMLGTIMAQVEKNPPQPPTITIIGHVVTLRDTLSWFGSNGDVGA